MKIHYCDQYSEEWALLRNGIPTASNFDRIVTPTGKLSAQRQKYLWQLAGERLAGKPEETYKGAAMERGTVMEAEARSFYELVTGEVPQQVGFCQTEGPAVYGCSPDFLVGENGGGQIKCPLMTAHVSYLLANEIPGEYVPQVQGELLVTGREWWDFLSYYPTIKPLKVRVYPDPKYQQILKSALEEFCIELNRTVEILKER